MLLIVYRAFDFSFGLERELRDAVDCKEFAAVAVCVVRSSQNQTGNTS